jgi:hypothetical protein
MVYLPSQLHFSPRYVGKGNPLPQKSRKPRHHRILLLKALSFSPLENFREEPEESGSLRQRCIDPSKKKTCFSGSGLPNAAGEVPITNLTPGISPAAAFKARKLNRNIYKGFQDQT